MESLAALRDIRRDQEIALADSQGLDITNITGWGAGKIDPIEVDLLACSTDYAESVDSLRVALGALSSSELSDWFDKIGWEPVGANMRERLADYLRRG
ncbi:MAG: hypothetical protein GY937_22865 [bacterium]|nr:hypothetical protein [bacterium]